MSARDAILGAVAGHLARHDAAKPPPPPAVAALGRVDLSVGERVARFVQRLEAVGGAVHRGDPVAAVTEIVARYQPCAIATSDAAAVAELRAAPALASADWLPTDASRRDLFDAGVGITTAQWAIAETGTIVLDAGRERSRLPSLVPPVHVALLPISRILCTMGEVLKTLGRPLSPAVTFVTGPSRTADIELELVLGVHGPRELHVVIT